jgi:hypothetical protein
MLPFIFATYTMLKKAACLILLLVTFKLCRAQQPAEKLIRNIYAVKQADHNLRADTSSYYLVQFKNTAPVLRKQQHLLKRLGNNYYIISSPQKINADENVLSASPSSALWKASDDLAQLSVKHPGSIKLISLVIKQNNSDIIDHVKQLATINSVNGHTLTVKVQLKNLSGLMQHRDIVFASPVRSAHPELVINDMDLGTNNIWPIKDLYPGINGTGINVSVKEDKFDEDDLDLLGRSFISTTPSPRYSGHATIMATLIGGNGNSFINGLGAAPAVRLTTSDFTRLLPDSNVYFIQGSISTQNHSYGTGIENYYGIEAVAYDQQVYEQDTLMHVFSSGNIGTTAPDAGIYTGIANSANLSGTFKQAKNVLVVGGTGRTGIPEALSSAGPAYDGRIKPEIVAGGQDGTSGAAALTSGTVALLQQSYKKTYGRMPSAALLKAVLINSADDIGTPHVDHKTGYGKLNALEALRTINDARFKAGSITNKQTVTYQITVPANCKTLKVSLAWNDAPATLNAPFALVNDLDLYIITPSGEKILPWTLSSFPLADSLLRPAIRKRDTLNNTEQITLQNVPAGVYSINISGNRVTTATQSFYMAYQFKLNSQFDWTYPTASSQVFAAENNYLRWKNTYDVSTAKLSISYDNGINWQHLADVNPTNENYQWNAPDVFTPAVLRMQINGSVYTTKPFVMAKPLTLDVGYDCTDGTLLHWNPQPGATGYVIYSIKDNILQKLTTAADTSIVIPTSMQTSKFFAVAAQGNGFEGIRSFTINATTQGVGCYVKTLLADVANKNIALSLSLGSTLNLKSITWEKLTGTNSYTPLGTTAITGTLNYNFTDTNPKKGLNYYRATLTTTDNKLIYSELANVIFLNVNQVTIYPNPVSTQLNVLTGELKDYDIKLYDNMGRVSFKQTFNGLQNSIPINVMPGFYVCTIAAEGKVIYTGKIIKVQ